MAADLEDIRQFSGRARGVSSPNAADEILYRIIKRAADILAFDPGRNRFAYHLRSRGLFSPRDAVYATAELGIKP